MNPCLNTTNQYNSMNKMAVINYKDSRWNYPYKGFTSIINQTIEIAKAYYKVHNSLQINVSDQQIENFYTSITKNEIDEFDASNWWLNMFFANQISNSPNSHDVAVLDDIKLKKNIFESILLLKEEYKTKFTQEFQQVYMTDCLGIQIRGTDKCQEIPRINVEILIRKIDTFLQNSKENYSRIFLSTDDIDYLNSFKNYFGKEYVFEQKNAYRSSGLSSVHHNKNLDRNVVNEQVLWDVYALATCRSMLYTFSNVSHLALCLGCDNHKEIYCLSV